MQTEVVSVTAEDVEANRAPLLLQSAVRMLRAGQPVAMPTETVYGLAANALDSAACQRIYAVKNRPADNPLIVHISSLAMLRLLVQPSLASEEGRDELDQLMVPEELKPILRRFWPGPLTVLLPKREGVPDVVTAGLRTVAVRFPAHPVAKALIEAAGFPLAAPSANLSGRPSPTTAAHVLHDLDGRISVIVDGGPCGLGLESTVLDATRSPPVILRPGSITQKMLLPYLNDVQLFGQNGTKDGEMEEEMERPSTPGMKYRHYSPSSPVVLFSCDSSTGLTNQSSIIQFCREELAKGKRIVRLANSLDPMIDEKILPVPTIYLSHNGGLETIAKNLFKGLRDADALKPDWILAEGVIEDDQGAAVMNRLSKAASYTY